MKLKQGSLLVSITLLIFFLLSVSAVFADENSTISELFNQQEQQEHMKSPSDTTSQLDEDSPGFIELLLRTVIVLSFIIVLIYGLSKWITRRNNAIVSNHFISVISGVNLGQNKSLRLVKVGTSYYLLGVGNDIQLLKEFLSEQETDEINETLQQSRDTLLSSSKKMWGDIRSIFDKREQPKDDHFQRQLEERLMHLQDSNSELKVVTNREEKQQNRGDLE